MACAILLSLYYSSKDKNQPVFDKENLAKIYLYKHIGDKLVSRKFPTFHSLFLIKRKMQHFYLDTIGVTRVTIISLQHYLQITN